MILFFNPTTNRAEGVCKAHLAQSTGDHTLIVFDAITRDTVSVIADHEVSQLVSNHLNIDRYRAEFDTLERQLNTAISLLRVVTAHSDNHDVFGLPDQQRVHIPSNNVPRPRVGMSVRNKAVLQAFKTDALYLTQHGQRASDGLDYTLDEALDLINRQAHGAIAVLPDVIRVSVTLQWRGHYTPLLRHIAEILNQPPKMADATWDEYIDSREVIRILNVSITSLNRYRAGEIPSHKPPFPTPARSKGRSSYWLRHTIIAWRDTSLELP